MQVGKTRQEKHARQEVNNIKELLKNEKVEWKKLGEVCEIKTGQTISKKMIEGMLGEYPVINSGREPLGYVNVYNTVDDPIGITSRGAGVGSITYQEGRYFRGHLNYSLSIKNEYKINIRYLYHALLNYQTNIYKLCSYQGIPALNASDLKKLEIPIPSLKTQEKIVEILDKFTEYVTELKAELKARSKQYEHYRDHLLSEEKLEIMVQELSMEDNLSHQLDERNKQYEYYRDKLFSKENLHHMEVINKVDVIEIKQLREVCKYSTERILSSSVNSENYIGVDNLLKDKMGRAESKYVPNDTNLIRFKKDDILIGNIRPYLRKIWLADIEGGTNGDVLTICIKENYVDDILPKYMYHILAGEDFFEYNIKHSKGAKMPRGDKDKIMEYKVCIPPLSIQNRVVAVLDKFQEMLSQTKGLLPKEIEERQKQYEYYREKLLTFDENMVASKQASKQASNNI